MNKVLTAITFILFGVFIASSSIAIFMKLFQETGIYIGSIVNFCISITGLYFYSKNTKLKIVFLSVLITMLALIAIYLIMMNQLNQLVENS